MHVDTQLEEIILNERSHLCTAAIVGIGHEGKVDFLTIVCREFSLVVPPKTRRTQESARLIPVQVGRLDGSVAPSRVGGRNGS